MKTCPICLSPEAHTPLRTLSRFLECPTCGLLFRPDLASITTPNAAYDSQEPVSASRLIAEEVRRAAYYRTLVRRVTQDVPVEGALLEIGCGAGGLLADFSSRGWQVEGIEPSPQLFNHAKTVLSGEVPLHPCELSEAGPCLQMRPYKAIIAVDVIEHLPDPFLLPRTAFEWLAPGGCLILQTPNAHSLRRYLQGGGWEQLAPREHFFLHTSKSLTALLKNAQFEGIHIRTVSGRATDAFWRGLLMKPIGVVLNLLGLGNALWAVARKGMP